MLLLVLFGIFYVFLFAGAVTYLILLAAPRTRRYALSAALSVAAFGSCLVGLLAFGGFGWYFMVGYFGMPHRNLATVAPPHQQTIVWTYIVLGLLGAIVVATGTAMLHQFLIHRFTLFLFRLYATAVSAGIGVTLTVGLSWWMLFSLNQNWGSAFLFLAPVFAALLGTFAYRSARTFRGSIPERFPWVTPEEFSGLPTT